MTAPLGELVGPGWADVLSPVESTIRQLGDFLREEQEAGHGFLPPSARIFAAFAQPFDEVRVLIVGQDPYPTPGHANGLAFSAAPDVRPVPRSLANIFREYVDDLGYPEPATPDLTPWTEQGVMLLNRVLTVRPGVSGSHRGQGWEEVTATAIEALSARDRPLVAILWGADARELSPRLAGHPVLTAPHPSPLSAHRGFFGSRPFSGANAALVGLGSRPVAWRLPA